MYAETNQSELAIDSSKTGGLLERHALGRWVAVLSHSCTWVKCSAHFYAAGQVRGSNACSKLKPSEFKYLQYCCEAHAFKLEKSKLSKM